MKKITKFGMVSGLVVLVLLALTLTSVVWAHSKPTIKVIGPTPSGAVQAHIANVTGVGPCALHADNVYYNATTQGHTYLNSCGGYYNIPMHGQGCLQANGGGGWYNVACADTGQFTGGGWSYYPTYAAVAPCGYWWRTWAWSQVKWLNGGGIWQTASSSLVSGQDYRC